MNRRWIGIVGAAGVVASALAVGVVSPAVAAPCDPGGNAIVCENSKPGTPQSVWDITDAGDTTIQGFATSMSVNVGETEHFKVDTPATAYTVGIYRLGWYNGDGARKIADVTAVPHSQPNCLSDPSTGLVDCGNWAESASWTVPSDAVSGVYIAVLRRSDTGGSSHVPFVVRDDSSHSDILFQTSDSTWQAYNLYGGNDFYAGSPVGRAYKLSYNRPFATRDANSGRDFLFSNEFPMLQFMERNGYDVSYFSSLDTDRRGALIKNHKVFTSTGHDEYWSGAQRANVEAARDAGVSLAFFSGNEVYWHTRWEPSIDGSSTDGRTLVCYKETWANGKIDPSPEWTGTWRDPRFATPSQGAGLPENGLTGTAYMSNTDDLAITVSAEEGKLRLWRNTGLASMAPGTSTALADHTIGYESDEDLDNGFRPQGLIRLSTTTGDTPEYLRDFGTTVTPGTTTHHLTMYRAASGALVFSAGSIQWAWGLSQNHDGAGAPADSRIQQATVNILADMGASANTLMSGLTAASPSADTTAPTATITSPNAGDTFSNGTTVTVSGTAADVGGRVAGVEVSTDGSTWHPASGTTSWSYTYTTAGVGTVSLRARAVDDSANIGAASSVAVTVNCPCSLFGDRSPATPSGTDTSGVELGVRFVPSTDGFVNAVRFYKGTLNTGTHTGSLWSSSGSLLAQGTFSNETASGWQTLVFSAPVAVSAGTTYVASYFAPNGHYAADVQYFASQSQKSPPLSALGRPDSSSNGVFSNAHGYPDTSFSNTNYWVDVLFTIDDVSAPVVANRSPLAGATSVPSTVKPRATFVSSVDPASISFTLAGPAGAVAGTVTYDGPTKTATMTPSSPLDPATQYTVSVSATSAAGVPMAAPTTWSFTTALTDPAPGACPCSIWTDSTTPANITSTETNSVELGVKFTTEVDGQITGIRFYKGPQNLGVHVGTLWTSNGTLLASATFAGESTSGWQTVTFSTPVNLTADTTYVASYRAPAGGYSYDAGGLSAAVNSPPLHTVAHGGLFTYLSGFPTNSSDTNYWVDVLFVPQDVAPAVTQADPGSDATNVPVTSVVTARFGTQIQSGSAQLALRAADGSAVAGSVTSGTASVTFTPSAALAPGATYTATVSGALSLSGQTMSPFTWSFTTAGGACPCTLFASSAVPTTVDAGDGAAVTLGVKFSTSQPAFVTGVRFYKGTANTGTHTGSLWNAAGARLATGVFTGETATGWQTLTFSTPVQLVVGDTYQVGYYAPNGHYAATSGFFAAPWQNGVLTAPAGSNGSFSYGGDNHPDNSFNSGNYWVDPIVSLGTAPDTSPPAITARSPLAGESSVATSVQPSVTFSEDINQASLSLTLKDAANAAVAGTAAYDSASRTATFTPSAALSRGAVYTATVSASDPTGNAMAPVSWSFTTAQPSPAPGVCPCSLWDETAVPGTITVNDPSNVELGLKFSPDANGVITGVRFYKGPKNVGTHTGSLWDAAGNRLATATFSSESTAGWQTVSFATPVPVTAGTTYIASYTSGGFYSATVNGLATAIDQPPLHTPAGAGLYVYGTGVPTNASTANYWVDVVFAPPPDTTPPVVTAVTATGSGTSATVTWTTDESSTTRVDYGATTSLGSTATGATGTSHSVSLTGLSNGATYYYRVTSADAAGNSTTDPVTTSAPRSFTIPDTVPPVVTAVTATGSGTSATVTWTTDESSTTQVDYGTTTSLGSTATGAIGTSHSVSLTGLTNGATYYYRVTSADAAGNSTTDPVTTSAPRTFTIPDTTPPVITAVAATGSGTTATVTWTTNESSTSRVTYGTTSTTLGSTATGANGTSHSVTLTGLIVNTRYYYRVTSVDPAGNSATSPATTGAPASYVPTVVPLAQTTTADFGTGSGGYVANTAGGEVIDSPTLGQEFTGTTLPSGWTSTALVTGGTSTFANGLATVTGSRLRTNTTWGAGSNFTAAATLAAGQSLGWGSVASGSTNVTASFVMDSTGALSASVNDGRTNIRTIAIPGTFTGASHEYRIDRPSGSAVFLVDGTQVATSAFAPSVNLLVMLTDPTTAAPVLTSDWVRIGPYTASSTFTSGVIDAGATVGWDTLTSDSLVPANTTLTIQVRSGPNANSGSGAWTAWTTVPTNGSITRSSRYIQYRLQFTSAGTRFTSATVRSVQLSFHVL